MTVIGELLLVSGLAVFGYIVWQPWHTGVVVNTEQQDRAAALSQEWDAVAKPLKTDEIPVPKTPAEGEIFAILRAPAFTTKFANSIAAGTDTLTVLDQDSKGIGHYDSTQLPGEPGNFVIAAHRSGAVITPFREIMNLRVGDPLFIETSDGWYVYRFRDIEYVAPDEVDVTSPFPRFEGVPGKDMILTLTTCHPKQWGSDERAIAYSVFEGFQPRAEGPPAELLKLNPTMEGEQSERGEWGN